MSDTKHDLRAVRQLARAALERAQRRDSTRTDEADCAFAAQLTRKPEETFELLEAAE